MAENENQSTMESFRQELGSLRSQIENMAKSIEEKRRELTSDMAEKIAREVEHARRKASERAHQVREAGASGLNEVESQVRQNPLISILIAFGLGWIVSCLIRHLR